MDPKEQAAQQAVSQSQNGPGRMQITPEMVKNAQPVKCTCGGMVFTEKVFFKKISAILSPSGKEEVIPMPTFFCENCGGVPDIFDPMNVLPPELKAKKVG